MIYEDSEYEIIYNKCDEEYMDELIIFITGNKKRILDFFNIKKLRKKLIIKLYSELNEYIKYRNNNINETSVGNMDVDDDFYYIHILSYKELIKRKGHENKNLNDFYNILLHEYVHICHEDYGTCHSVLRWIKEGSAIFLSKQNYKEGLINCSLESLINNGSNNYQSYYTLIKYSYDKYGEEYLKKLMFNPKLGKEETIKIYNEYINDLAKSYSEGNNELYNCLLELWKNGFETIGCCRGHDKHVQYIGLNRNNNDKIIKFLSSINKDDITISFLNNHVSIKKNKNRDIYDDILDAINIVENNTVDIDNKIEESIKFIDDNNYKYVNIHHYYFKGELNKYINTSDLNLINDLKGKYEYKILNEKLPMYHFIIK